MTQVTLFYQGVVQILQAALTGLAPGKPYVLGLSHDPTGAPPLQALARTNTAGVAIVNRVGLRRNLGPTGGADSRRFLVIVEGTISEPGKLLQRQVP